MFRLRNVLVAVAVAGGAVSCSLPQAETQQELTAGADATTRVDFAADDDVAVFIFRKDGGILTYYDFFNDGWADEGEKKVRSKTVLLGEYQFLFAKGFGENLTLEEPEEEVTELDDMVFRLVQGAGDYYLPSDEIYLPLTAAEALTTYQVKGPRTISATLKRAVGQVNVELKRGYVQTNQQQFTEIPYTGGDNILNHIDRIVVEVAGVGSAVGIDGGSGSVTVMQEFAAADYRADEQGFASITGPMVIPPAEASAKINIMVTLYPSSGSALGTQPISVPLSHTLVRNQQITARLWLDHSQRTVEIEINVDEISDEQPGETGIWN